MRKEYITKGIFLRNFFIAFSLLVSVSCTKENLEECVWVPARIRVVPTASRGASDETGIERVTLYVFDKNDMYVDEVNALVNDVVELSYPKIGALKIIAVANNNVEHETVTAVGHINSAEITLVQKGMDEDDSPICNTPSDLFYGSVFHKNEGKNRAETHELPVIRVVGSAKVTVKKLRERNNAGGDEDFSVVVCTNHRKIDFMANASGGAVSYSPSCGFEEAGKDVFVVPAFNVISSSSGEDFKVKIYKGDVLVDTIDKDDSGRPLRTRNGSLLDVFIDYSGTISVSVSLNGWGIETPWDKDFNQGR